MSKSTDVIEISARSNDLLVRRIRRDYTLSKSVVIEDEPDARTVWLKVGVQSFEVATAESEEHAEWYRDMLANALAAIVEAQPAFDKNSDCRDEQTAVLSRLALGVWENVKAQGATDMEALAMVYHAGANHLNEATGKEQ